MSKKKKSPRAPFVVTVAMAGSSALALSLLPACGSNVVTNPPPTDSCPVDAPKAGDSCSVEMSCDYNGACGSTFQCTAKGTWTETTPPGSCNPPAPVCPDNVPSSNTPCTSDGQSCQYSDNCGGSVVAYCGTLEGDPPLWQLSHDGPPCNPPPCPDPAPSAGTACPNEGQICSYQVDFGCGPQPVDTTCTNGAWTGQDIGPTCNPPPPCFVYDNADSCALDPTCQWLTPGCGMPALPVAGCHSQKPCVSDADCEVGGYTCQSLVIDPCWNKGCDACGETVLVCMPPPPP